MADLHETLKNLGPTEWADVPADDEEKLGAYLKDKFEAGELICNSVPPPQGGTDFSSSQPALTAPDSATTAAEIEHSEARPPIPDATHAELQSSWGKPLKVSAKENPLQISVYKMAGKDRHGAWFARRSVHEGISFTKMKKAMKREFAESLACQGGPGDGNVRGIGGDRRLERRMVEGVGQLEVYQLSAQFPGPTTPREFITLLLTSENALSDKSSDQSNKEYIPRHYMVVSKPITHPDAPERNGYIRGQYESVEMIREIPIFPAPKTSGTDSASEQKHELNPVEWIMITRSDPGGGIPRFMVDRGTPGSICSDAVKFLNWATGKDNLTDPDDDEELQKAAGDRLTESSSAKPTSNVSDAAGPVADQPSPTSQPPTQKQKRTSQQTQQQDGGMYSNFTNAIGAGFDAYAPTSVAAYAHGMLGTQDADGDDADASSDSSTSESDDDSSDDFHSTTEGPTTTIQPRQSIDSLGNLSVTSSPASSLVPITGTTRHDKELRKLEAQQKKLDAKLAAKREAEEKKLDEQKQKDKADVSKAQEKHDKELRKLEERREREIRKLERKKEKELKKAEQKRAKNLDRETTSRITRERDDFRTQLDMVKKENGLLKEQIGDLQRENMLLVQKLSKTGGVDSVKSLQKELQSRSRASSAASGR